MNNALTNTSNHKHLSILRIVAGAPLIMFGIMHITGAAPMLPLVEAAGLPLPELTATLAPIAQLIAGLLLISGALARFGALIAIVTMLGGLVTNFKIPNDQWPTPSALDPAILELGTEPAMLTPIAIVVLLLSVYVLFKGAGAWSFDSKLSSNTSNQATSTSVDPT
jgi:uncharacterized membrane protein YphA (DoxX/SURF4 family)